MKLTIIGRTPADGAAADFEFKASGCRVDRDRLGRV
jgi:hypothetical protein